MTYTLAIDIGGTKIAVGLMKKQTEWIATLQNKSNTTNENTMYNAVVQSIYEILEKTNIKKDQVKQMGITVPGQLDIETGLAIFQLNLPWRNFPLGDLLRKEFPKTRVCFEHDVAAAALGEWAVRNLSEQLLVYMTVSTGIAASIIYKGEVIRGMGLAGEVGLIPSEGTKSLEESASGSAMEKAIRIMDENLSLQQAFALWEEGNDKFEEFFDQKARQLAVAIFNIVATLDPHKIVLGGGVLNHQKNFFDRMLNYYSNFCIHPFQDNWIEKIERSRLEGTSGLYGVAMKARNQSDRKYLIK